MRDVRGWLLLTIIVGFFPSHVRAQTGTWSSLPNAPLPPSRINDGFFISPNTGWVVSGAGLIYKTTNGGSSWTTQLNKSSSTHFRSVGFVDSLRGWAGCLGIGDVNHEEATDTSILYGTTNGGTTWTPVNAVSGAQPRGFCGMHVVNDSVICAVGRVRGPATFYRTSDRGTTWTVKDMNAYAAGLVDVYFVHPDTGFAVGLTNSLHDSSSGVVLSTFDGGQTWIQRFKTSRKGEWCWKISFPSRNVAYVSLQRNSLSPIYILKSTDGGMTWSEKLFSSSYYFVQGIGFKNDSRGWIGGSGSLPAYETTDGGSSWRSLAIGIRLNRFRFLGDTLGYAVGASVYKYTTSPATRIAESGFPQIPDFYLGQNYPNPFNPSTSFEIRIANDAFVSLKVYNMLGREVASLLNGMKPPGIYTISWDARDLPTGIYFYRFTSQGFNETKKMILVR